MKKYIAIIAVTASMLALNSCKKVLETEPFDKISEDVVWSTKANAETFIFSTYSIMGAYQGGQATDLRTANIMASGDGSWSNASPFVSESITRANDYGFNNWGAVRRCNLIIKKVAESPGISDADKKALIAEGKFLRAMSYYNIARTTGRIVWIDKVLTPDDELKLPSTANPTESYGFIIKDLEDAIVDLPTIKIAGRANKYVAASFLTEVCLQALAYKNYPAAPNVNASDPLLQKVIDNANLVINTGGYSLEADYGGMFNETKKTSPEIIFGIYRLAANTTVDGTPMQTMVPNLNNDRISRNGGSLFTNQNIFEAWGTNFPTQNFTDDYLTIDKANPTLAVAWNKTSQYLANVDESATVPSTGTGHNVIPRNTGETTIKSGRIIPGSTETIWSLANQNRDARWKATIWSDSTERIYGEQLTTTLHGNADRWMRITGIAPNPYVTLTNMYWKKGLYTNVNPRPYVGVPTDYHYVAMRLGRVYLNLAEAFLLKGDLANAVLNLNKTRVTHGQLPVSQATTMANAWTDYKRERRVDLVMENDFYYSLLRWGRYGGDANDGLASGKKIANLTEVMRVMDVSKDRKSFVTTTGPFGGFPYNNRQFDETRRYLLPIAQSYIDNNSKFGPQNPGW
ncbi:RagB/SusD family nutrient uptake outer membrane protein [Pedobacter borealis]|uniref:RagB/SusD family nutrient uptake outer membrane protein n=1 Tax=Pedobacter borealis TaxID=475254 RepID=UPI00068AFE27|nr:RagB/SusD family nutrient uptake outer membrane protein [Pedobacter borealis]